MGTFVISIWAYLAPLFDPFGFFYLYSLDNDLDNLIYTFYNVSCLYFSATYSTCYLMRYTALKRISWVQFAREFCCCYVILLALHLGFLQGYNIFPLIITASLSGMLWAFITVSLYNLVLFMAPPNLFFFCNFFAVILCFF